MTMIRPSQTQSAEGGKSCDRTFSFLYLMVPVDRFWSGWPGYCVLFPRWCWHYVSIFSVDSISWKFPRLRWEWKTITSECLDSFFLFFPLSHSIHFDCLELWWFAFVFQREHLKIAQQYFQLVGGSASECGKLKETLCAMNISLVNFMHGQEYTCLFLSEIYRAWLF